MVSTTTDFFSDVPRIGELQDSETSPRREEVGRRALGAIGGFPLSFFYRARFRNVHAAVSGVRREASKTVTDRPPGTSRVEESDSARKVLHV